MIVKYLLCPGFVTSKTDGQAHYIGARTLADLYGVQMHECKVRPDRHQFGRHAWGPPHDLIELHPRNDGDYTLPKGTT